MQMSKVLSCNDKCFARGSETQDAESSAGHPLLGLDGSCSPSFHAKKERLTYLSVLSPFLILNENWGKQESFKVFYSYRTECLSLAGCDQCCGR